ncbi:MAG: hypothetical protein HC834_07475, partial [Rhodospirillales bacterium]|nr:hypothetical protein [Rhodospirillales bacterium]
FGSASVPIRLAAVAPAVFRVVVNAEGGLPNTPLNPAARGAAMSIYATGLGAVLRQGNLAVAAEPVSVVIQGQEIPASFAGRAGSSRGASRTRSSACWISTRPSRTSSGHPRGSRRTGPSTPSTSQISSLKAGHRRGIMRCSSTAATCFP